MLEELPASDAVRALLCLSYEEQQKLLTRLDTADAAELVEEVPDQHAADVRHAPDNRAPADPRSRNSMRSSRTALAAGVKVASSGFRGVAQRFGLAGRTERRIPLVNGLPIAAAKHRRDTVWRSDGPGFADIAVIDAGGNISRSTAELVSKDWTFKARP